MPADMVVFGEDWGRHPSSTQHIMRRLAAERRMIWVNSLGLRRPQLNRRDMGRLASKAASLVSRNKQPADVAGTRLQEHHPFAGMVNPRAIPYPGSRLASAFNRRSLSSQVGNVMRKADIKRPILWTSLPTALPIIGELGERAVVYYAGDDFAALAGVDHQPVLEAELRLAEKADLVLAASCEIASRFDPEKTKVLPHGVDYDLFAKPQPRSPDLPSGKTAGFYGSLNGWIDIEGIAAAARQLPDWTIILIGKTETDITPLLNCRNVLLRPPMPHHMLAQWSQHWDVSLLPFLRNRQIDASNPLKLREYLAAGRPVAATYRFGAIDALLAPVSTPVNDGDLAEAILAAPSTLHDVKAFREKLAGETWEARAATVSELLATLQHRA